LRERLTKAIGELGQSLRREATLWRQLDSEPNAVSINYLS
jgi:hypothetical protein